MPANLDPDFFSQNVSKMMKVQAANGSIHSRVVDCTVPLLPVPFSYDYSCFGYHIDSLRFPKNLPPESIVVTKCFNGVLSPQSCGIRCFKTHMKT